MKRQLSLSLREGYHTEERHAIALLFAEPEPRTEHRVEGRREDSCARAQTRAAADRVL